MARERINTFRKHAKHISESISRVRINTWRQRARRVSKEVNEKYFGASGTFGGRRKFLLFGTLAVVALVAVWAGRAAVDHSQSQLVMLKVGELRHGVGFLTASRNGTLPHASEGNWLQSIIGHGYMSQESLDRIRPYRVLSVATVQGTSDQYRITIECSDRADCERLEVAFGEDPGCIRRQRPAPNQVALAFRL